jgi:NAD-dependent dihydropyrimidine dehydrogenase PreA subunit
MSRELPFLDDTRCTGCEVCIRVWVCPTDCLALAGTVPRLVRPLDCISCTLCMIVCPTEAIRMTAQEQA